jgi:hypothetical protein
MPAEAEVISIAAGDERTGVDVRAFVVPSALVAGTLYDGGQPATNVQVRLMLGEDDNAVEIGMGRGSGNGRFSIMAVPAGRYTFIASRIPRGAVGGRRGAPAGSAGQQPVLPVDPALWTSMNVVAGDPAFAAMSVTLEHGGRVRGRLDFGNSARPTPEQLAQFRLTIVPAGTPMPGQGPGLPGRIEGDGTFLTNPLTPGRYRLRVFPPAPWRAKSAIANGIDMLDTPVQISTGDIDDVMLTIVDSPEASIAGVVRTTSGESDPEAIVVVMPANELLYGERRLKVARTTTTGEYTVPGLPAGDYIVAVASEAQYAAGLDRELLTRIGGTGTRVSLSDGDRRTADLRSERGR